MAFVRTVANPHGAYLDYQVTGQLIRAGCRDGGDQHMAKNTGQGSRRGAVRNRSEFKHGNTWFKRDTTTGRILNGSPHEHKGVRNEK